MVAKSFSPTFEVFSYTVSLLVGLQSTAAFGQRYLYKKKAPLNLTAFLASILTSFYALYGLVYWFNGSRGYTCTSLQVINGMCLSSSNALSFVHLFLKADASNKMNPKWRYWRVVGIITTAFNWVTLVVVHALLTGVLKPNKVLSNELRCVWTFDTASFKLKWIAQFVQHVLMAALFCWPLIENLRRMKENSCKATSVTVDMYKQLVVRAIGAMIASGTFNIIATALVLSKVDHPTLKIPSFGLSVLDNAVTVYSIYMAMNVNPAIQETEKSYQGGGLGNGVKQVYSGASTNALHSSQSRSSRSLSMSTSQTESPPLPQAQV